MEDPFQFGICKRADTRGICSDKETYLEEIGGAIDSGLSGNVGSVMDYTPLKMKPCFKEYLWGGTRLKRDYGKADAPDVTAESWELSCHPDGCSVVENGAYKGWNIRQLDEFNHDGFCGTECQKDRFPLLVKLIDAKRDLSIQVHPSDQNALSAQGESGKAEMWYIVDCEPQASIYFGFSKQVTKEEFLRRASDGTICDILNKVPVSRGDVFYILPGTIHAIGAGIVIAEIQQNSNTTFRIYDYQRRGSDGELRPLHLERAAEVLDYTPIVREECKANSCVTFSEFTITEMFSCRHFRAYRVDVHKSVELVCDGRSFQHILCVEGAGNISAGGDIYTIKQGESYLMPAALGKYKIEGECRVLVSRI